MHGGKLATQIGLHAPVLGEHMHKAARLNGTILLGPHGRVEELLQPASHHQVAELLWLRQPILQDSSPV